MYPGQEFIYIVMNGNTIAFSQNDAGLKWGNSNSQIYDDTNFHIH